MQLPKFNYQNNLNWNDLKLFQLAKQEEIPTFLTQFAKTYPKRHLFMEGNGKSIYFILKGQIKSGKLDKKGEVQSFTLLQTSDVFGLERLKTQNLTSIYAEALTEVEVAVLPVAKVLALMENNAIFNKYIFQLLVGQVERLQHHFDQLTQMTSRQRIILFLLEQINKRGKRVGYEYVLWDFYIHRDIAELTNTSRQTVTTVLNELKRKKLIDFNRRRLLVRDLEQLEKESLIAK